VDQALSHPYFEDLHDTGDEPVSEFIIKIEDFKDIPTAIEEIKIFINCANNDKMLEE